MLGALVPRNRSMNANTKIVTNANTIQPILNKNDCPAPDITILPIKWKLAERSACSCGSARCGCGQLATGEANARQIVTLLFQDR
jgi:hypothetical protein